MTIQVTGKNVDVGDAYQTYASDKLRNLLNKYVSRDVHGHIRLEKERTVFRTSCSVKLASGLLLEAHGEGGDAYASADEAVERLEKRVRRYKDRLRDHATPRSERPMPTAFDARDYQFGLHDDGEAEAGQDHPVIVAETERSIEKLTVGEAVMKLDLTESPFMIFSNAAHGGLNVVYRRSDGHIGWIDASQASATAPTNGHG